MLRFAAADPGVLTDSESRRNVWWYAMSPIWFRHTLMPAAYAGTTSAIAFANLQSESAACYRYGHPDAAVPRVDENKVSR